MERGLQKVNHNSRLAEWSRRVETAACVQCRELRLLFNEAEASVSAPPQVRAGQSAASGLL